MQNGKAMTLLVNKIQETMTAASTYDEFKPYVKVMASKLKETQEVMNFLSGCDYFYGIFQHDCYRMAMAKNSYNS